jgi:Fe-S-cluster-containing hydrogenase component 2
MSHKKISSKFSPSKGYLVVDPKKCAGRIACMLACSMVHEGKSAPSLSRIQVDTKSWWAKTLPF